MPHRFSKDAFLERLSALGGDCDREVLVFETLDSTSSELRRRFEKNHSERWAKSVTVAHRQTGGRGRLGRVWHSPPEGNLCLSVAMRLNGPASQIVPLLPLAAGLAARDAAMEAGASPLLKWPNDLLVQGRKAAGILCEAVELEENAASVVVGIGVNVIDTPFPSDIADTAVALNAVTASPVDISALAARFVSLLEAWNRRIAAGVRDDVVQAWRKAAEPFGRRVKIGEITGKTVDLAKDGRLVVENDAGEEILVAGGIVESLDLF